MKIENKKAYIPCEIVGNQINNGLDIRVRIDKTHDLYINRKLLIPDIDQPKPVLKKEHAEWLEELKNEFPDNLPNQLYHITRQGWGYGLVFESNTGQKIKISNLDDGKLKKDLVNALIYGYTVEKEKSYQIIDKRLNATFSCLGYDIDGRAWFWGNKKFFLKNKGVRLAHTRQQLIDAGFEEVFENPNYEAEEVANDL